MSGFSSLNLGSRALFAAQRGLDVAGQNVSNANTEGYSRQRVEQSAAGRSAVPAMYARSDGSGDGVDVTGLSRIRDSFLEARAQHEHGTNSSLNVKQQVYGDIETSFAEPSDSALQQQMSDFWNSWDEVVTDPSGKAPRSSLLQKAGALAGSFSSVSRQLTQQWADNREQLGATVADVNAMAKDVAKLNATIRSATVAGISANELSDQRDSLVLKLGQAIGAVSTPGEDGTVNITVGGSPLVMGERSRAITLAGPISYPGTPNSVSVVWDDGSLQPLSGLSGATAGRLDGLNTVLPDYLTKLDGVAAQLAATVNAQQANGYDLTAGPGSPNGQAMFTGTTAATLALAFTDPDLVAASAGAPPALDGDNALAMAAHAGDLAGADATYRALIVGLGVDTQSVNRQTDVQAAITQQVDNARQSVSGVSLDEEMTNLVSYQHAFEAAARFIQTIDSTLETLINMTR
jgi:flagellar hook-associated protein 1